MTLLAWVISLSAYSPLLGSVDLHKHMYCNVYLEPTSSILKCKSLAGVNSRRRMNSGYHDDNDRGAPQDLITEC